MTRSQSIGERSMNIIATLEKEEIERLGKTIPDFAPGDTVIVNVSVVEGERKRVQAYEGVVIAKRNRGLNSSFVVRKISSGEGVERTFQTYSPLIAVDRGEAQGRRAPREALLPARPLGQVGAHSREARARAQEKQGKRVSLAPRARSVAAPRAAGGTAVAAARFFCARKHRGRALLALRMLPIMRKRAAGAILARGTCLAGRFPEYSGVIDRSSAHWLDESLALRSAGYPADRLRRGRARGAARG